MTIFVLGISSVFLALMGLSIALFRDAILIEQVEEELEEEKTAEDTAEEHMEDLESFGDWLGAYVGYWADEFSEWLLGSDECVDEWGDPCESEVDEWGNPVQ